jgi:Protein of unknown function (DUF3102)
MAGKLTKLPRAEQWADRICGQIGKTVESIIEVGRLLVKAKKDLPHGEWGRMFDEQLVTFGVRTAERLMTIAKHPVLSNTTHASYLPPSWTTIYDLTKVEPKRLNAAFKDGLIVPDMPRKAVKALLPSAGTKQLRRTKSNATPIEDGYRTAGSRLYARIARMLSDDFDTLSSDDQAFVVNMLEQTLSELRTTSSRTGTDA